MWATHRGPLPRRIMEKEGRLQQVTTYIIPDKHFLREMIKVNINS